MALCSQKSLVCSLQASEVIVVDSHFFVSTFLARPQLLVRKAYLPAQMLVEPKSLAVNIPIVADEEQFEGCIG